MTPLAQLVLDSVPLEQRESVFRPCTLRLDTSETLGMASTFDCENGELHAYTGEPLEITPERDAALRGWVTSRTTWNESALRAAISERRWKAEVSGCEVFPGVRFPTTRDSRATFALELALARQVGESYSKNFEIGGRLIPMTLAVMEAVSAAIQAHVDAAFSRSEELIGRIDAGELLSTVAADIENGWSL